MSWNGECVVYRWRGARECHGVVSGWYNEGRG